MEREPAYYSVGEDPFTTGFPLDDLETFFAQTTPVVKLPAPTPTQMIMESQATNPVGGDDPFTTGFPLDIEAFFAQAPVASKMEDFLVLVDESGAGHTAPDSHSSGDTSCCASNIAADMGRSSPLPLALEVNTAADMGRSSPLPLALEVNTAAGLRQSGAGGGFKEAAVLGSCKRKKLVCSSSSHQRSTQEFNLELLHVLVQSDPSATDINPPAGSTDKEIVDFLRREVYCMPPGKAVNLSLGEQDQICPKAVRSYVTTVEMMPDQKTHLGLGCWKEKQGEFLRAQNDEFGTMYYGVLKRTFQFHNYDGTKTNWFMHEYIPSGQWGIDLFMEPLRFRVVYEDAEVPDPGKPTSPEGKIKNKISAAKKHRMRGPENMVIKGESPAWQHFIKIYDRHPELEGSKVVYAVCCHCEGVLKAGTENGTKSLLTHWGRTCPVKNKKQQPRSSSSYQENLVCVGVR